MIFFQAPLFFSYRNNFFLCLVDFNLLQSDDLFKAMKYFDLVFKLQFWRTSVPLIGP